MTQNDLVTGRLVRFASPRLLAVVSDFVPDQYEVGVVGAAVIETDN